MKSLSAIIILFGTLIILAGCASAPTNEELQNADYGNPIDINTCITVAQTFIANQLKDPDAARPLKHHIYFPDARIARQLYKLTVPEQELKFLDVPVFSPALLHYKSCCIHHGLAGLPGHLTNCPLGIIVELASKLKMEIGILAKNYFKIKSF